jgi:hypothetical protein
MPIWIRMNIFAISDVASQNLIMPDNIQDFHSNEGTRP